MDLTTDHRRSVENIHGAIDEPITEGLAEQWGPKAGDRPNQAAAREAMRDAILIEPFDWYKQKLTLALDGIELHFKR